MNIPDHESGLCIKTRPLTHLIVLLVCLFILAGCAARAYAYGYGLTAPCELEEDKSIVRYIAVTDIILPVGYSLSPIFFVCGVVSGSMAEPINEKSPPKSCKSPPPAP